MLYHINIHSSYLTTHVSGTIRRNFGLKPLSHIVTYGVQIRIVQTRVMVRILESESSIVF